MKLRELFEYIDANYDEVIASQRGGKPNPVFRGMLQVYLGKEEHAAAEMLRAFHAGMQAFSQGQLNAAEAQAAFKTAMNRAVNNAPSPLALAIEAEAAMAERGFVDYELFAVGGRALMIKGMKQDGSYSALRFSYSFSWRPPSIIILAGEPVPLSRSDQQIEILPFADEVWKTFKRGSSRRAERWSQNMLYALAMLHSEGKYCWDDEEIFETNIVRINGQIWISDPEAINELPDAQYAVQGSIIRQLRNGDVRLDEPDACGISTSEYFIAFLDENKASGSAATRAWAERNKIHLIDISALTRAGHFFLLVDPSRKRAGPELAESLRAVLAPGVTRLQRPAAFEGPG
ncbi:MAG TPA: hypothetical protein VHB73_01700 [Alphaproteobacteria bacterium]|nr:hypothetical protein [Alphaproteobacteria bacterium]